jgi:hypothetical protein
MIASGTDLGALTRMPSSGQEDSQGAILMVLPGVSIEGSISSVLTLIRSAVLWPKLQFSKETMWQAVQLW